MSKLPDWRGEEDRPNPDGIESWAYYESLADFYMDRAAYYESRLRVAVEALTVTHHNSPESVAGKRAGKALAAIGPLPDKGDV